MSPTLLAEHFGVVRCGEAFEEGGHGGGEGVVVGVGGGEESVSAGYGEGVLRVSLAGARGTDENGLTMRRRV